MPAPSTPFRFGGSLGFPVTERQRGGSARIFVAAACNIFLPPGFVRAVHHAILVSSLGLPWRLEPPDGPDAPFVGGETDDDAEVFQRAVRGDQQAWQELFDRWKKPLLAFFYRSLGSMAEAEDLALDVFVRLHRAGPCYEPRAPFATFLFRIARNLLLNEWRRRRRKPVQPMPPDAFDYLESPGTEPERRLAELEESFQRALDQLPEAQRTLILLVHQQGLPQTEAAKLLSLNDNALRVQLHRARERLKQLMMTLS